MSRRRRAAALLGLSLLLGVLAASDVARREAALRRQLGPVVRVIVARTSLRAGERITPAALGVRRVPVRYAPSGAVRDAGAVIGRRAAVPVAPGADLDPAMLAVPRAGANGAPSGSAAKLRDGERALEVLGLAASDAVVPGTRVDVLITSSTADGMPGFSRVVLRGAEVLATHPAQAAGGQDASAGLPRVRATLRVRAGQATDLVSALAGASEVRLLVRPTG